MLVVANTQLHQSKRDRNFVRQAQALYTIEQCSRFLETIKKVVNVDVPFIMACDFNC